MIQITWREYIVKELNLIKNYHKMNLYINITKILVPFLSLFKNINNNNNKIIPLNENNFILIDIPYQLNTDYYNDDNYYDNYYDDDYYYDNNKYNYTYNIV